MYHRPAYRHTLQKKRVQSEAMPVPCVLSALLHVPLVEAIRRHAFVASHIMLFQLVAVIMQEGSVVSTLPRWVYLSFRSGCRVTVTLRVV